MPIFAKVQQGNAKVQPESGISRQRNAKVEQGNAKFQQRFGISLPEYAKSLPGTAKFVPGNGKSLFGFAISRLRFAKVEVDFGISGFIPGRVIIRLYLSLFIIWFHLMFLPKIL